MTAPAAVRPDLKPAELRDILGIPFTDEQLRAATSGLGPGLIVAGAGSGKTSVMAARVVWLVLTGQVAAEQVLGLTFTVKAAAELAVRIETALTRAGALGDGATAGVPTVSTYHAFAGRLLSEHALRLGIEPRSRLLADASRFQLAARVLRKYDSGPIRSLTTLLRYLVGDLVALESEMSEHLVEPNELLAFDAHTIANIEAAMVAEQASARPLKTTLDNLAKCAEAARKRRELTNMVIALRAAKRDLDAVDFGDQVAFAARLAERHPEVGAAERARAGVVLLDEYQDTSVAQRKMLAGLFGGGHPVTAVGDPAQAIYGWRGASVSNIGDFPEHFPQADGTSAPVYELRTNMRSGGRLLKLANAVVGPLRGDRLRVVELHPRDEVANDGRTVVALHETWAAEVAWVAQCVRDAVDTGTDPGECAVLVRARVDIPALYTALTAAGLPVEVVGLGGLLGVPEVADVVAVLELLDDPTANSALLRLLTGPRWRFGTRDLAALGKRAAHLLRTWDQDEPDGVGEVSIDPDVTGDARLDEAVAGVDPCDVVSLLEALERPAGALSPEARERALALAAEIRELRSHVDEPLLDLVQRVVELTGLDIELAASPSAVAAHRRASLAGFLDVVAGYADLDGDQSLPAFLAFLRAAEDHERGLDSITPRAGRAAVQLLTAHKAKGLEWDVVVVPDMTQGVFPVESVRGKWITTGATLPVPLRDDHLDLPEMGPWTKEGLAAYDDECRKHLAREERRLAYVAVTRARHMLIASGHWWGPTQIKPRGPSPYLSELRAHVESDPAHGEIAVWAELEDGATNPALVVPEPAPWPAELEPQALAARQAAARVVLDVLDGLEAGAEARDDDALTDAERAELAQLDRDLAMLVEETRRGRRRDALVPLPRTLTASQVVMLRTDPDGLAHDLARPMPRRPAPAALRGTRFHAWVETRWGQRPLLGPDELPGAEDDEVADDASLEQLQAAFLASPYAERVPFAVEAPFALTLAGRVVRGRIDAVYDLGDGRWEVVDWKTGSELADAWQLGIYRLAWARLRGVPLDAVDAAFFYVRDGRTARPPLPTVDELAAALTAEPAT
ncbi:MAG TPA: ATP-dependent DNA helicase [Mycobacteriales bacterium]|nr:ATP-dependent DNA helicase [Mycobacteriales bacterium]